MNAGPETYAFGYEIKNPLNNNAQFREEEKFGNGTIHGSHGYARADGYVSITHYIADESGYHSAVESFIDPNFHSISRKLVEDGDHAPSDYGLMVQSNTIRKAPLTINIKAADSFKEQEHLHPKIASVINGEISLTSKNTDIKGERKIGFFIPDTFPIPTFELPTNKTN